MTFSAVRMIDGRLTFRCQQRRAIGGTRAHGLSPCDQQVLSLPSTRATSSEGLEKAKRVERANEVEPLPAFMALPAADCETTSPRVGETTLNCNKTILAERSQND
jgi:hypothetical protein